MEAFDALEFFCTVIAYSLFGLVLAVPVLYHAIQERREYNKVLKKFEKGEYK